MLARTRRSGFKGKSLSAKFCNLINCVTLTVIRRRLIHVRDDYQNGKFRFGLVHCGHHRRYRARSVASDQEDLACFRIFKDPTHWPHSFSRSREALWQLGKFPPALDGLQHLRLWSGSVPQTDLRRRGNYRNDQSAHKDKKDIDQAAELLHGIDVA